MLTGSIRSDFGDATYDVWIQGGAGTTGSSRNLAQIADSLKARHAPLASADILQMTGGPRVAVADMQAAIDELRKRGQAIAQKRGGRAMKEGLIMAKVAGMAQRNVARAPQRRQKARDQRHASTSA